MARVARAHAVNANQVFQWRRQYRRGLLGPGNAEAMERIAALYAVEKEIRGHPAGERHEVRNARAKPLLDSLKQWLEETLGKL